MKTNKIIAGMTLTGALLTLSSTGVFADESENKMSDKRQMMEKNSMMKYSQTKDMKRDPSEGQKIWGNLNDRNLEEVNEDVKEEISELVEEFQENTQELMDEYKEDFDELKQDYKEDFDELKQKLNDEENQDVQDEIREEMTVLKDEFETALDLVKAELENKKSEIFTQYKSDISEILWEDSTYIENLEKAEEKREKMKEALEEKKAQMEAKREEMKEKMQEAKEKREEFRENAKQRISSYKNAYANKIEDKLAKLSTQKLQKFNIQLEELFTKVESSETMSDDNKEMMLSRITALQDLIIDVINQSELDLNELLEMQL